MQIKQNQKNPIILFFITMIILFTSCEDVYEYDNKEPDFLGPSIYETLKNKGDFTYFLRLIDDLNYQETLSRTGSKTLLVAKDDAFKRFFSSSNVYGVKSYEELSFGQKREIMNVSMLNMAYLSYMLANSTESTGLGEGLAMRRNASNTYLDSVSFVNDPVLFANPYWKRFDSHGLYLLDNENPTTIIHFTQTNMTMRNISESDFSLINNGIQYKPGEIFINQTRMIEKDIICKNGYIHVMEDLLTPLKNISQIVRDNGQTGTFNRLMNKFCLPYYVESYSKAVHDYYDGSAPDRQPMISPSDSVFVKRYFTPNFKMDPQGKPLDSYGLLYFDPSDNGYNGSQQDVSVMFIPTDKAMDDYINGERGKYLKNVYGSWDNVPTSILALFIKNHQKMSFVSSLPHSWPEMNDEASYPMNVKADQILRTYTASNGFAYLTNTVYPPIDYQSVYASIMTTANSQIMNWGIRNENMKFFYYLRSMENMYNMIVPTDEAFQNYRDPVAWGKGGNSKRIWAFKYVPDRNAVYADSYLVDADGNKGAWEKQITDQSMIRNRLKDIIDMHIVVGEKSGNHMSGYIDDGTTQYALTKGGATIKLSDSGDNTKMTGGGDIEQHVSPAEIVVNSLTQKKDVYDSDNGRTYFINKIMQDPIKSVYTVMGEHPEYEEFFNLLKGDERVFSFFQKDKDIVPVFDLKKVGQSSGLGYVVNSFNNFRYTVFVPTAAALKKAFEENDKLFTWDEIANEENPDLKKEKTLYLLKFLKYHFMDNSIYIDGRSFSAPETNETAARNLSGKFYKLVVNKTASNLQVMNENQTIKANVILENGIYNLMARDYIVDSGSYMSANNIVSSSRSVIHLIDKALEFDK